MANNRKFIFLTLSNSARKLIKIYWAQNFFDSKLTRSELSQTERTRRLACLPSFCELVLLVPPKKFLVWKWSHPKGDKITKFTDDSNIPAKKVKVQVGACQTSIFSAKLQQKSEGVTFTFLLGIFSHLQ